jgi:hypothetical protein
MWLKLPRPLPNRNRSSWTGLLVSFLSAQLRITIAIITVASAAWNTHAQSIAVGDRAYVFGSVHVNYRTPPGYLAGYSGDLNYVANANTGTQGGPILYVGNYGKTNEPTTGTSNANVTFQFFRIADDINSNGGTGAVVVVDPNTGALATITDFGDLHEFNIAFDRMDPSTEFGFQTVDLCGVLWLNDDGDPNAKKDRTFMSARSEDVPVRHDVELTAAASGPARRLDESGDPQDDTELQPNIFVSSNERRNGVGIVYGFRALDSSDAFGADYFGGILGGASTRTFADNQIVGPQIGVIWAKSRGKWSFQTQGTVLAGYNDGQVWQRSEVGAETIPSALNRPLYAQPVFAQHSESHQDFSPGGELRAETSYHFSESLSLKLAWSGIYFDNVLLADNRTVYYLPTMGLRDPGNQHLIVQDLYCGIEYLH